MNTIMDIVGFGYIATLGVACVARYVLGKREWERSQEQDGTTA